MSHTDAAMILAHPFGLALIALLVIWRPWREDLPAFAPWALPLTLAAAYPLGRLAISGLPGFPPPTADEWLVFAAVALGCWAALEARFVQIPHLLRRMVRLGFVASLLWLMVASHISPINYAFLVVGLFSALTFLEQNARSVDPRTTLWAMTIAAIASAPILLLGASFRLALLAATLGAFAAAAALLSTAFKAGKKLFAAPLVFPFCLLLAGLFVSGVRFAMTPLFGALAIAAALLIPLSIGFGRKEKPKNSLKPALLRLTAVLILSTGAVTYTYYETKITVVEENDDEYDPYTW